MKYLIQGNFHTFNVTLTQNDGTTTTPYIPTENDKILINLNTANKQFQYKDFSQSQNVLTFTDNGCLSVGVYQLEVKIIDRASHKLRCMYRDQLMVVASNDDIPLAESFDIDDVNLGAEISINPQIAVDDELSLTSENPVQNKVVTAALNTKVDDIQIEHPNNEVVIKLLNGNTIIAQDSISPATNASAGVLTWMDKQKLDGIEEHATKVIVDSALNHTSPNAIQNQVVTAALNTKYDDILPMLDSSSWDITFKSNGDVAYELYIGGATSNTAGLFLPSEKTKLGGIEAGANKTIMDSVLNTTSDNPVQNKVVTAALNTKGDKLESVNTFIGVTFNLKHDDTILSQVGLPFAALSQGKGGLMSGADYSKLSDIEAGANKTVVDSELHGLSSNPVENRVITQKLNTVTQKLATKYDTYEVYLSPDAIDLYFMADGEYVGNWYIESANSTNAGLMSASDKTKLSGIEAGANKTIVDNALNTSSNNAISNSAVATALGDIETILDNILGN